MTLTDSGPAAADTDRQLSYVGAFNEAVYGELLGLSSEEIAMFTDKGIL